MSLTNHQRNRLSNFDDAALGRLFKFFGNPSMTALGAAIVSEESQEKADRFYSVSGINCFATQMSRMRKIIVEQDPTAANVKLNYKGLKLILERIAYPSSDKDHEN